MLTRYFLVVCVAMGCGGEVGSGAENPDASSGMLDAVIADDAIDASSGDDVDASVPTPDAAARESPPFVEREGVVIMEMESVQPMTGANWESLTNIAGYTGVGYYRFEGNGICNGPARDPLRYSFRIVQGGVYQLRLRAARLHHCVAGDPEGNNNGCSESDRTCTSLGQPNGNQCAAADQCIRTDISNDAFVFIEDADGEYLAFNEQPGSSIGEPIKLFGGGNQFWSFTGVRALDTNGSKFAADWTLQPGDYTLVVQGRSQFFSLDRIVFFDPLRANLEDAAESPETRP